MLEFLNGYQLPEQVVDLVQLRDLDVFGSPGARACVDRVLVQHERAECEVERLGVEGRGKLACRGVPVLAEDGALREAIWLVDEAPVPVE